MLGLLTAVYWISLPNFDLLLPVQKWLYFHFRKAVAEKDEPMMPHLMEQRHPERGLSTRVMTHNMYPKGNVIELKLKTSCGKTEMFMPSLAGNAAPISPPLL